MVLLRHFAVVYLGVAETFPSTFSQLFFTVFYNVFLHCCRSSYIVLVNIIIVSAWYTCLYLYLYCMYLHPQLSAAAFARSSI